MDSQPGQAAKQPTKNRNETKIPADTVEKQTEGNIPTLSKDVMLVSPLVSRPTSYSLSQSFSRLVSR